MSLLHEAYTALLSGATKKDEQGRIEWTDDDDIQIFIEPIDAAKDQFVVYAYYDKQKTKLALKDEYCNGKRNGKRLAWHENGQLKADIGCVDGEWEGKVTTWHENGTIETHTDSYTKGVRTGKHFEYDEKGRLKLEVKFDSNGQRCGSVIEYYDNGKIESEQTVDNIRRGYYKNGKPKYEMKPDGNGGIQATNYDKKGNLIDSEAIGKEIEIMKTKTHKVLVLMLILFCALGIVNTASDIFNYFSKDKVECYVGNQIKYSDSASYVIEQDDNVWVIGDKKGRTVVVGVDNCRKVSE